MRPTKTIILLSLLVVMLFTADAIAITIKEETDSCMMCHKYPMLARVDDKSGDDKLFYIDEGVFYGSTHSRFRCRSCHKDITKIPHDRNRKAGCTMSCHITSPANNPKKNPHIVTPKLDRDSFHPKSVSVRALGDAQGKCHICHGKLPHTKSLDLREMLNMHTGYISCEACHIRSITGAKLYYAWKDNESDAELTALRGMSGQYGGKISAYENKYSSENSFIEGRSISATTMLKIRFYRFIKAKEKLAEMKASIHDRIVKNPVLCYECHAKGGYLELEKLLYSKKRAEWLTGLEVRGMTERFNHIYIPIPFDPALIRKRREILKKRAEEKERAKKDAAVSIP